ncbi:sodium bicarbonate transporter-like protein 11 isoform X1 [Orbicella faveolata]|uniref:sodium bicarbonate transporter-like protein 11 isoform X1 n=2 Tax=Orbicella faveolata TaxID=48498 RepID=UPI0009E1FDB6|nr:sodium bicarbonate transporter-like protein 11 isoform X1 [Orbicella faveolata]
MEKSFTPRSDTVKEGKVSSKPEGIAKGRDSLGTNEGTPKDNETNLTPAFQMHRFSEDESELETVEIIALNSSGQELRNETADSLCGDDVPDTSLMLSSHQKLISKNFTEEIRAAKDVETFLERPTLLLGLHETSLQGIVDKMLEKLISVIGGEDIDFEDARMAFFTHDSVHCLSKIIQGTEISEGGGWEETQNWLIAMGELPSVQQSHVAIAQLRHPVNLGRTLEETHLVVLVLAPSKAKSTKNSLETGRTFATLLSDIETRQLLIEVETEEQFKKVLSDRKDLLSSRSYATIRPARKPPAVQSKSSFTHRRDDQKKSELFSFGRGLIRDLKRRWPHYLSDFKDGIRGRHTIPKLISTTLFLYFACLLPSIAFGVLNSRNTNGQIDVQKVIISQAVGGTLFALFGGQPLIVMLTTAPLALYIKVIYNISADFDLDFLALYSCTGLWNSFFLFIYSTFGLSQIMKWSTRSTEEIFALFISLAFTVDAVSSIVKEYSNLHCSTSCWNSSSCGIDQSANNCTQPTDASFCHREGGLSYAVVSLGTVWIGLALYNFRKSPFLDAGKREALADYALVVAVLVMSFVASYFMRDIQRYKFEASNTFSFSAAPLHKLSWGAVFAGLGLGFSLSLLFFMDQNISSAMVNNPGNRLKKGSAYHWDLLVVAAVNSFLSLFGLPWVHAALPHSPFHVRALADVEERVDRGHVFEIIVKVRETRLSGLLSSTLIALSLLMLPTPLTLIPTSVLDGLFLFMAITSLDGNQMFERALLLVTEQAAYPPNHYIRHVPQRKMHLYTALQFLMLGVLCGFGFAPLPYLKMVFPVLLMLILPIRHLLVPRLIPTKYLKALDAHL